MKTIGKEYTNKMERIAFLKDNCDKVVETFASVNGRDIRFILLSPGAEETLESIRDATIDEELDAIKEIAPNIAIIEE